MPIRKPKPKVVSTPPVAEPKTFVLERTPPTLAEPKTFALERTTPQKAPVDKFRMIHTRLTMRQWRQVADQARDDDTSVQALVVDALRAHLAKRGVALE
jgi:hypothetical protein